MGDTIGSAGPRAVVALDAVSRPVQLKDVAYERLREAIIDLSLPPGTQLREAALATQLGISKTPLREAFVRLEREGFVEVQPYRGATVRGYSPESLVEIFELRALLEGFSAARAAESTDEVWRDRLRENVERSRRALTDGDLTRVATLVEDFDVLVQECTDNPRVAELLAQIQGHVERIGRLSAAVPGRLEESVGEHERIAEAVLAGHSRDAELRMRAHVQSVMRTQLSAR
jgi:GntR family transcriptional regulator, rspAB operon transcriptional repressor